MAKKMDRVDSASTLNDAHADSSLKEVELEHVGNISGRSSQPNGKSLDIWVGFERGGRHFIDKIELQGTAEMVLLGLRYWWESSMPLWDRWMSQIVLCSKPFVAVGSLPTVSRLNVHRVRSSTRND